MFCQLEEAMYTYVSKPHAVSEQKKYICHNQNVYRKATGL